MATASLENQPQYLNEATKKVKEQGFYMKRAMDSNDLKGAFQHASDMLRELRTSLLTPRNYYELRVSAAPAVFVLFMAAPVSPADRAPPAW